jgi:hypothetical protein
VVIHKGKPRWEIWRYSEGDSAESRVLPGWLVEVATLFEGLND